MLKHVRCLFLIFAAQASFGQALANQSCGDGMYPAGVEGWSSCGMEELGEVPIWKGIPPQTSSVMRFVFTQGHGTFFRVVTISERANGTGVMKVSGAENRRHGDDDTDDAVIPVRRIRLSTAALAHIKQLAETSGTWDFGDGTWDAGDSLFMHCQMLEMERATETGYRYSSVSIGCNQPRKLMPLVDEIARLARLRVTDNGMLYR